MKILVTGIRGQLGFDVLRVLKNRGIEAIGLNSDDMDIKSKKAVDTVFDKIRPDACIHPAAWTLVDKAEDEKEAAEAVNVTGTKNIALASARVGASLMYFSTDYVFDGGGERPWKPEDKPDPQNVYGLTKLEGEKLVLKILPGRHFILRLEWLYGINGKNFVKTMLDLSKNHKELKVVCDQIGSPTYTLDVASLAADMIVSSKYGIYHVSNTGYCSWYDFALEIFKNAGISIDVVPVTSENYPQRAKRPHNSRFDTSKLITEGFKELPSWQDALKRFMREYQNT